MANGEWQPAKRSALQVGYEEASINFTCPCSDGDEIFLSGDDAPVTCSACGRTWRYLTQLQVKQEEAES